MWSRAPVILSCAVAALLWGCAAAPPPAARRRRRRPRPAAPRDAVTAAAIEAVLAGEHRSAEQPCPRCLAASARHAAVLRHQARHDGRRGVARRRWLVHRGAGAAAGRQRQVVRRPDAARPGQPVRDRESRELPGEARGAPGSLRQGHGDDAGRGRRRHRAARQLRPGRDLPQPAQLDESRLRATRLSPRCTARSSPAESSAWSNIAAIRRSRRIRAPPMATSTSNTRSR